MNNWFEKNVQFLPQSLKDRVLRVKEEELWGNIKIDYAEASSDPLCTYQDTHRSYQITSIHPVKEAEEWCQQLPLENVGALFIYGCGFGYGLFELLKQKQPNTIVIVFEQNVHIFAAMLIYFDFEPIFRTQKFSFFIGALEDFSSEFEKLFWTDVFLYCTSPSVVFTPVAQRQMKAEYLQIHKYIFETLSLNIFYIGNDHNDTLLGFHNMIANAMEVVQNPYLSCLKDRFHHVPAFIISNGPSLDKNIQELKNINGKGLILSTESAIIPLMKNGIKPDAICIIERTPYSYLYHFENRTYPDDIALLSLAVIDKQIYPAFSGPRIPIFRNTESINGWINQWLGDGIGLNAGANTSHLAFQLAVYLGANPIVLVGQDFAFGPGGATHSKDAVYSEEIGKEAASKIKAIPVVQVESNEGTLIPSNQLWVNFKQGLEQIITTVPDKTVLNATEGGAKIKGTTCESLAKVIEAYCTHNIENRLSQLIKNHKQGIDVELRWQKLRRFIEELDKYVQTFRGLCQQALQGMIRCQSMIQLSGKADVSDELDILEQAYNDNFQSLRVFMTENLLLCFLQQVLVVGFHHMNQLGLINTPEKTKRLFQIHYKLFNHLNLICQSLVVNYEMAIEKLQLSLKEEGGNNHDRKTGKGSGKIRERSNESRFDL